MTKKELPHPQPFSLPQQNPGKEKGAREETLTKGVLNVLYPLISEGEGGEFSSRVRYSRQRGFGLLEALIAISLMSLLFLGAMTLVIESGRATVRTQSQVYAIGDAANSIQDVIGQLREASAFTLPTGGPGTQIYENGWVTPTGTSLSQFSTTLNGAAINTAIEYANPAALTTFANGYNPSVKNIQVMSTVAHQTTNITPYDVFQPAATVVLIYRGDPDGTPDANPTGNAKTGAGTYLWQYTIPTDGSFNLAANPPRILCKTIGTARNAVQFVRPSYAGVYEKSQLEIKIVSSYYSPINGQQTSEEGNGATSSQLVGKCVYMRDHNPTPLQGGNTTQQSNNPFQYQ